MIASPRPWIEVIATKPGPCLGAVFTTFGFDPRRFEERVLASLLELKHDPQEDTLRFLAEARARVREVPVEVYADARQLQAGHRVPYDLVPAGGRTFHPKVAVLAFADRVRLVVGSANLTAGGLGENAELCVVSDLAYEEPEHRSLLEDVRGWLRGLSALGGVRAPEVLAELERRIPRGDVPSETGPRFLHTLDGPLLPEVARHLGPDVRLERISVLAPFYEEDGEELDASVLHALRGLAGDRDVAFDVALPWDDNVLATAENPPPFRERLGELWAYHRRTPGGIELAYFVPTRVTEQRLYRDDARGRGTVWQLDDAEAARAERATFPVGPVRTFGPEGLLDRLEGVCSDLAFWLFPARRVEGQKLVRRPLHGKAVIFSGKLGRKARGWVVVGSANLSRRAWLEPGGNVEAVMILPSDEPLELAELAPGVVRTPRAQLRLEPRRFQPAPFDPSGVVKSARYHAAAKRLELEWEPARADPGGFRVRYLRPPEQLLFEGVAAPSATTVVAPFDLALGSAELTVTSPSGSGTVPIAVVDPAALPADPVAVRWALEELRVRFGSRWGRAAVQARARAADGSAPAALAEGLVARGFAPTDVFRAWHGLARELADPLLTLGGLKVLLDAPDGARALWRLLVDAAAVGTLAPDEAWFHGLELHRTLRAVEFPDGPDAAERRALLAAFCDEVRAGVVRLEPPPSALPSAGVLKKFYALEAP